MHFFSFVHKWWGQLLIFVLLCAGILGGLVLYSWRDGVSKDKSAVINNYVRVTDYADPSFGDIDAPIQIYEFADFGCPYCLQMAQMMPEIVEAFGGKVRWVFKDFPIVELHESSQMAAEAGQCAFAQDKFLEIYELLFSEQPDQSKDNMYYFAEKAGLDMAKFRECFDSRRYKSEVESDLREGIGLGINGTPTWVINGTKFSGVIDKQQFMVLINEALKKP